MKDSTLEFQLDFQEVGQFFFVFLALLQATQSLVLDLADAFTAELQVFADVLERRVFDRIEAVEHAEDFFFALRK